MEALSLEKLYYAFCLCKCIDKSILALCGIHMPACVESIRPCGTRYFMSNLIIPNCFFFVFH